MLASWRGSAASSTAAGGTIDLVSAKPYTSIDVGGVAKGAGEVWGDMQSETPQLVSSPRRGEGRGSGMRGRASIYTEGLPLIRPFGDLLPLGKKKFAARSQIKNAACGRFLRPGSPRHDTRSQNPHEVVLPRVRDHSNHQDGTWTRQSARQQGIGRSLPSHDESQSPFRSSHSVCIEALGHEVKPVKAGFAPFD